MGSQAQTFIIPLNRSWVNAKHKVIVSSANFNLTASGIPTFVVLALAKCAGQVRDGRGANALREAGCTSRIREEAEDGCNWISVGTWSSGRLVGTPCLLRNGNAWHLCQKRFACVGGIGRDGCADAIGAALFAGVRGRVILNLANVGPATDIGAGAVTNFQLSRSAGCQLLMGMRDETGGNDGRASTAVCRRPMDHIVGVELGHSRVDARRWGGVGCS